MRHLADVESADNHSRRSQGPGSQRAQRRALASGAPTRPEPCRVPGLFAALSRKAGSVPPPLTAWANTTALRPSVSRLSGGATWRLNPSPGKRGWRRLRTAAASRLARQKPGSQGHASARGDPGARGIRGPQHRPRSASRPAPRALSAEQLLSTRGAAAPRASLGWCSVLPPAARPGANRGSERGRCRARGSARPAAAESAAIGLWRGRDRLPGWEGRRPGVPAGSGGTSCCSGVGGVHSLNQVPI